MDINGLQKYREQAINTMTQGELLLLLYDELLKHLTRAELAIDRGEYPLMEESVGKSEKIIQYLDDILDRQYDISGNLSRLYDFFGYELARVKAGRNKTELVRVKGMIAELRDSFRTAQKTSESGT